MRQLPLTLFISAIVALPAIAQDAGTDAGMPTNDAGTGETDAGMTGADAGMTGGDAGVVDDGGVIVETCDPATYVSNCDGDGLTIYECNPNTMEVEPLDCGTFILPEDVGGVAPNLVCGTPLCVDSGNNECDEVFPAATCIGDTDPAGLCGSPIQYPSATNLPYSGFCEGNNSCSASFDGTIGDTGEIVQRCLPNVAGDTCAAGQQRSGCTEIGAPNDSMSYCFEFQSAEDETILAGSPNPYVFRCTSFSQAAECVEGANGGSTCVLTDAVDPVVNCFGNAGIFGCGSGGMASGACDYGAGMPVAFGGDGKTIANGTADVSGSCIADIGTCTPPEGEQFDGVYPAAEWECRDNFLVTECHTYVDTPMGFQCDRIEGGTCGADTNGESKCIMQEGGPCQIPTDFRTPANPYRCDEGLLCGSAGTCIAASGGDGDGDTTEDDTGCGCTSTNPASLAPFALGALGLLASRRRRRR